VIIGQDPYPNAHAHGLSFSTTQQRRPVSLNYIFKEICDNYPEYDIQKDFPTNNLTNWAKQGVFLLNSVLTVQEGISNSHEGKGWEQFTQATIRALIDDSNPRVFMLWGRDAQRAFTRATATPIPRIISRQAVLECGHPAAAAYGKNLFSGNRHFVQANEYLLHHKKSIISWKTGL
jgi:uracil-DNA glycosylase